MRRVRYQACNHHLYPLVNLVNSLLVGQAYIQASNQVPLPRLNHLHSLHLSRHVNPAIIPRQNQALILLYSLHAIRARLHHLIRRINHHCGQVLTRALNLAHNLAINLP